MGVDYTAYAAWGWQIPYDAVPQSDPEEDEDFETDIEALCQGIDGLSWLQLGAPAYGWDRDSCPLVLCVGSVARVGFHDKISSCLKFSGEPFTVREILMHVHQAEGVTA